MRALALILILANVCFFFWSHYIDVPEAGPLAADIPTAQQTPRLLLATEGQGDSPIAAAQTASELSCISIGPFGSNSELEQVSQHLKTAGFTNTPRTEQGEVFAGYWVSLQDFATRAEAEQALTRLRADGVTDAYILPDSSEGRPNVLSVGLFSEQARAEQRRDAIATLGFQPQLQNRMKKAEVQWLDVALQEPGQRLDPTLLQPDSGGIVRLQTAACPGTSVTPESTSAQNSSQASSKSSR